MSEDLKALQDEIGAWGDATFPSHHDAEGQPDPRGAFHHLTDYGTGEVWELREVLGRYLGLGRTELWRERVANELADCQHLLCTIAHLCGVDLAAATRAKFEINKRRKWAKPDASGVSYHVEEPDRA